MDVLSLHESTEQNEHSKVITLLIERCMADAGLRLQDIDAVALSEGPGSYTSLRVGFSTAKGLCYALDKPLVTVSTLAALASAAHVELQDPDALYCAMIDARRMEVYAAVYDAAGNELIAPNPLVIDERSFGDFFAAGRQIIFCGNGAEKCKMVLTSPLVKYSTVKNCCSVHLVGASMGAFINKNFTNTAYAIPVYLKPPNITSSRVKPS